MGFSGVGSSFSTLFLVSVCVACFWEYYCRPTLLIYWVCIALQMDILPTIEIFILDYMYKLVNSHKCCMIHNRRGGVSC
jgi:hypothetical protein